MNSSCRGFVWLLLLALCFTVMEAADETWGGCEDPVNGKKLVTIGKKTTICLSVSDGTNWTETRNYMRLNFQPLADEYSRFVVPKSFNEMIVDSGSVFESFSGKEIAVHAASQMSLSFQKKYYDPDGDGKIFPFLTAVIDVRDGVVQGVAWDDASIFCGTKQVERNTFDFQGQNGKEDRFGQPVDGCYFTKAECQAKAGLCDLVLYAVWTGTDAKGGSFLSSSYRYSAFPPQEWGDRLAGLLPDV